MKNEEIEITPEIVKQLAEESERLSKEFQKRIEKMWEISVEERFTKCK